MEVQECLLFFQPKKPAVGPAHISKPEAANFDGDVQPATVLLACFSSRTLIYLRVVAYLGVPLHVDTTSPRELAAHSDASRTLEGQIYAKVTVRLLPFLFACYVAAYLDRVNVGSAKLQMLNDLSLSEMIYGIGADIFFIGYFFFEVPSNIILHRVGARAWIVRIMITWAALSAATAFASTPLQFYIIRFFLGTAEAGFFPGIVFYLT